MNTFTVATMNTSVPVNTTFSHGTFRPQDLVPVMLDLLRTVAPAHYDELTVAPFSIPPAYAQEDYDSDWWTSSSCAYFVEELFDALDEHAPYGYYFGSHPGDGSDFGYWSLDLTDS